VSTSFNQQFGQHGAWRREFALRLRLLSEWMESHELIDAAVHERLRLLESQVRSDKVMVAFVAEFSRGKSELINAIFFAQYGRRIMPASAGRTTMCPTELGYDAEVPPCLRLLPIETRLQPQALMEWRNAPEQWLRVDLDVNDPAQLAKALEKVAEVRRVTQAEARALGFWHDDEPQDNPPVDAQGMVEVPRWRHALINFAHPLLQQGLVILDTPGLNAIGAEPELTVNLIPQAHAVVFILGADTGVTKSDLTIWREHLITDADGKDSRLVVLNKIDTLWDELSTPAQVQAQIDRQCTTSADILGLPHEQVIAVSAQRGLVAKVTQDQALLEASCLPKLEQALAQNVLGRRQDILRSAVAVGIADLRTEAARVVRIRRVDMAEQSQELQGLRGKNQGVIQRMRLRVDQEQVEFTKSNTRIHAVRSVHLKLLRDAFDLLGVAALRAEMLALTQALREPGIKFGIKKTYGKTFGSLTANLNKVQSVIGEMDDMLGATFRQLNADLGFSLQVPVKPDLGRFQRELDQIQRNHEQYLSVGNVLRLAQADFTDRLVRALSTRVRLVYESALGEVELWSKSATSQLDTQMRERRKSFSKRITAIERIQEAAGALDERLHEIATSEADLLRIEAKLNELTSYVMHTTDANLEVSEFEDR
jgi:hypothetical protein